MRKYQKEMEDFEMLKISLICYKNMLSYNTYVTNLK